MKYIKLFEEHSYSVYELITMGANQVLNLLIEEIRKENPDLELIKDILEYSVIDINSKNSDSQTALIVAARNGREKCVELLLKHPGIDVNLQTIMGNTALMLAAYYGKEKAVELLLNHPGIDITLEDRNGQTVWDLATIDMQVRFPQLNPDAL